MPLKSRLLLSTTMILMVLAGCSKKQNQNFVTTFYAEIEGYKVTTKIIYYRFGHARKEVFIHRVIDKYAYDQAIGFDSINTITRVETHNKLSIIYGGYTPIADKRIIFIPIDTTVLIPKLYKGYFKRSYGGQQEGILEGLLED